MNKLKIISAGGLAVFLLLFSLVSTNNVSAAVCFQTQGDLVCGTGTTWCGGVCRVEPACVAPSSLDCVSCTCSGVVTPDSVPWSRLSEFPNTCGVGSYIEAIGTNLTCKVLPAAGAGDNWGTQTAKINTTLLGDGTDALPLRLNLASANTWTANITVSKDGPVMSLLDTINTGSNAELQLTDNTSHWGIYNANTGGSKELRFWYGSDRVVWNTSGTMTAGTVPWARLTYPAGCSAGQYVSAVGSSLTCVPLPAGSAYSAGTGLFLNGTIFNARTTSSLWNANQLQGRFISVNVPASGQVLKWDGTAWAPAADYGEVGDNLGNHVATQALNMNSNNIFGVGQQLNSMDADNFYVNAQRNLQLRINTAGPQTSFGFFGINSSDNQRIFTIDNEGRVGIGTMSPYGTLEVIDRTASSRVRITGPGAILELKDTSAGVDQKTKGIRSSGGNFEFYKTTDANTTVYTQLIILNNGTVGIGTASPSVAVKLDVSGGVKIGASSGSGAGIISYSANDFWGYDGTTWKSLTAGGGVPTGLAGGDLTGTYPNPTIASNKVTSAKILDGTIALSDLASNSVDSLKIVDLSIATADIADSAITSIKIADGAVATANIANTAVTAAKLNSMGAVANQVLTWNGTAWAPANVIGDNWGAQSVATNPTLNGSGTTGSLLGLNLARSNTWTTEQIFNGATSISNTGGNFYLDSNDSVQIRLDKNNNTADYFKVNNGANSTIFQVSESGQTILGGLSPFTFTNGAQTAVTVFQPANGINSSGSHLALWQSNPVTTKGVSASVVLAETNTNYWAVGKKTSGGDEEGMGIQEANNFLIGYSKNQDPGIYEWLTITPTGNVGISNSIPTQLLDIGNSTLNQGALVKINSATGYGAGIILTSSGVRKWSLYRPANSDDLRLGNANSPLVDTVTFKQNGNVGIGDNITPTEKLDVAGQLRIRPLSKGACDATRVGVIAYEEVSSVGHFYGCVRINSTTYSWKQIEN